jgi:hypothetical protein
MSRAELQTQPVTPEPTVQPPVPEAAPAGPQRDPWLGRVGATAAIGAIAAGGCAPPTRLGF